MGKPRIIIADTDEGYVLPLELKFARDWYDRVELEIITDPAYFEALFSRPQRAELLIVDRSLYREHLREQDIHRILLLTDCRDPAPGHGNVQPLYKYAGIRELFDAIADREWSS